MPLGVPDGILIGDSPSSVPTSRSCRQLRDRTRSGCRSGRRSLRRVATIDLSRVRAARWRRSFATCSKPLSLGLGWRKELIEEVAEREAVLAHRVRAARNLLRASAELVVEAPLRWITKHVVRTLDALEEQLLRFVATRRVGMKLASTLPVGAFDVVACSLGGDPERGVVIDARIEVDRWRVHRAMWPIATASKIAPSGSWPT